MTTNRRPAKHRPNASAPNNGANAAAAGIPDPAFALIDAHKARVKECTRLQPGADKKQVEKEYLGREGEVGRCRACRRRMGSSRGHRAVSRAK
jgi:hypothetical protein